VRPGDRISAIERVVGVEEKQSKFSGRLVLQYVEACYYNQRGELLARGLGTCTRHERKAARDAGKYKEIEQHEYGNEERDRIDQVVLDEPKNIRGANVRYWEDVKEGEELPTIARGPLSLMDTMGFLVGCGRGHTHGVLLQAAVKHPAFLPQPGGRRRHRVHWNRSSPRVGCEGSGRAGHVRLRSATLLVDVHPHHQLDGRCRYPQARSQRDAALQHRGRHHLLQGKVVRKYVKDKTALVDIEIAAENQRGEVTTPGLATVALPSRDVNLPPLSTGRAWISSCP